MLAVVVPLHAQPATVQPGTVERERKEAPPPRPEGRVSIPSLDAPRMSEDTGVRFTLRRVEIEGNTVLSDQELMGPFAPLLGQEVSIGQIFAAADAATHLYDKAGYALSLAYVPAQEVKDGVVVVRVVEGYIADVMFRDTKPRRGPLWDQYAAKLKASKPLQSADLERYLLLAGDSPGVRIKSVFERMPDAPAGAVRLVMLIERKQVEINAEVNNRGSRALGPKRAQLDVGFNGLMGSEGRVGLFGVRSIDGGELAYYGGRVDVPMDSEGTVASFEASISESNPGVPALSALEFEGQGSIVSLNFSHAFKRSLHENLYGSVGMIYKNLSSDLLGLDNSHDRITALALGLDYDTRDRWGGTWRAFATMFIGVDLLSSTQEYDPLSSRAGASGQFGRIEGSLSHLLPLSSYFSIFNELAGQVADGEMLVSEQCGYGGGYIGRAFDPFELAGDHCVKGRSELRFDVPPQWQGSEAIVRGLQLYALADFGVMIKSGTLLPLEERVETGESVGLGVRIRASDRVSGFAEVMQPLDQGVALENGSKDPRFFFGLSANY